MASCAKDNRLSIASYRDAMEGVETQFALIRFALRNLPKSRLEHFFKSRAADSLSKLKSGLKAWMESLNHEEAENLKATVEGIQDFAERKAKKKNKPRDFRFKFEMSDDRINQSELLLLVSHFESFMKMVHRRFLEAAPSKVFSQRDTKIMLRDIFDPSVPCFNHAKFLNELIIKEVKFLDSQSITFRAEYFEKHFGISFGASQEVADLKEIMDLRNKLSHESFTLPPRSLEEIKDQLLVSDGRLYRARVFFLDIPRNCISVGAKTYQSYFKEL